MVKIKIEVDIFDDPEFCESESDIEGFGECCEHLTYGSNADFSKCSEFRKKNHPLPLFNKDGRFIKHSQCKTHYQKAKAHINPSDELPEGDYPDSQTTHFYDKFKGKGK